MSALSGCKAGLTDSQRVRQASQREQLKRDLEEQMAEKRAAAARRKADLAKLEEKEEAEVKAYWAAQQGQTRAGQARTAAAVEVQAAETERQGGGRGEAARRPPSAGPRGGASRAHVGADQLGNVAGGARRGEALVQPGVTVFLPPDKEAEWRGALRARQATQSCSSEEAEAVQPRMRGSGQRCPGAAMAPWAQQMQEQAGGGFPAAAAAALLGQQQALPFISPAQAAALLAAAGMPVAPYPGYMGPPHLAAGGSGGAAAGSAASDPQVLALLREMQHEQQRMRDQLAAQLEAVSRLSGVAADARSERDRACQDLERVQRLLAERQGAQWEGSAAGDQGMLAVTTHVLPIGAQRIPSRLGSPATSARGPPPAARSRQAQQDLQHAPLPARYRQQAEQWQAHQQGHQQGQQGTAGRTGTSAKQVGAAGAAGGVRQGRQGAVGGQGKAGIKPPPPKGWHR